MTAPVADAGGEALAESAGFRRFYAEALPHVYGYFIHRCGGRAHVAEELTQETFVAAVRELRKGVRVEVPQPWILGIARHKLLDHYRREDRELRRLHLVPDPDDLEVAETARDDGWTRDRVVAALAQVSAAQRAALALRYLDGLAPPEVAQALGRSLHATESLLARGRESFRRAYREAEDA
ncbi:MAG TPA: RNA polymerase sigma factor [Miltoncostaeaceae bacterium]|nr:RNA polymerase sigma factor [Miltoncostaeaceae bacterium]